MRYTVENAEKIRRGQKTQDRRPVGPDETLYEDAVWKIGADDYVPGHGYVLRRIKYQTGGRYAVQPGGGKGVGFIRILRIRRERLHDISLADCIAEGIEALGWRPDNPDWGELTARAEYAREWDKIYGEKEGKRWADNPPVFVYEFVWVGGGGR